MKSSGRNVFKGVTALLLALIMIALAACGGTAPPPAAQPAPAEKPAENKPADPPKAPDKQKLVIYTARDKTVIDEIIPKFNAQNPNIEVEVLTMGAQQIMERVRGEKANPQADFWWGGTQSALMTAANEGLLESYKPSFGGNIPDLYKDSQDRWYGEMLLPEVIMYNSKALKTEDAPKDWDDLLDPKYKGKIIIRGVLASGTMRTIYSSMIFKEGGATDPAKGYEWLKKLDANTKEYAQDPTNLYLKLAREEGTLSLWNLQDILIQKHLKNQPFDYIYPASGAPILVDGVGLVKGAKNSEAAKKFYEFLFDPKLRVELAEKLFQIPTRTDISKDTMPEWLKGIELKPMDIDWNIMAEKEKEWMQHWDENIKGKGGK
ncbi:MULTISPECIES: extracellular solute-binding protein [unclassified Paenibacillus]|uniref:extracellular solute-binding protein n=1 Tax=unclassified Paenibacillus TaxID=185978 RepID=UPI001AE45DE1|nr:MULTISPECIES: extracellular solute-binding protein [unclassified Paenibacillus]MBP1156434.1 iron(III) transport system substrate-binding protein [Paenibacillus sp. PvP091]MBP1168180.1 iron(III) transport system substrate-binding protein [Paenibacillus sp. PvR098]MBP2439208.1 iron(III) transport system substrate-binding protein [Paenibacillus sp. PvP052]